MSTIINLIVYSQEEGFEEGAKILSDDALKHNKQCAAIEIKNLHYFLNKSKDTLFFVYFLTSDITIPQLIKSISPQPIIINKSFLLCDMSTSKFNSLKKVGATGISIPEQVQLTDMGTCTEKTFPIPSYLKSKNPRGPVRRIETRKELLELLNSISETDKENFYLEKDVLNENNSELKFYYVDGNISVPDTEKITDIPQWFKDVMKKISNCVGLQAFSADFIIDWDKRQYYCFDINHASAFFKCKQSRLEFINKILK